MNKVKSKHEMLKQMKSMGIPTKGYHKYKTSDVREFWMNALECQNNLIRNNIKGIKNDKQN